MQRIMLLSVDVLETYTAFLDVSTNLGTVALEYNISVVGVFCLMFHCCDITMSLQTHWPAEISKRIYAVTLRPTTSGPFKMCESMKSYQFQS